MERVRIRIWRMAKGVPYGTLLWFDETKEMVELYKLPPIRQGELNEFNPPLDSGLPQLELDIPLSVSA